MHGKNPSNPIPSEDYFKELQQCMHGTIVIAQEKRRIQKAHVLAKLTYHQSSFGISHSVIPDIRNRESIFSPLCRGFAPERRGPFGTAKGPKTIDAPSGHITWDGRQP